MITPPPYCYALGTLKLHHFLHAYPATHDSADSHGPRSGNMPTRHETMKSRSGALTRPRRLCPTYDETPKHRASCP